MPLHAVHLLSSLLLAVSVRTLYSTACLDLLYFVYLPLSFSLQENCLSDRCYVVCPRQVCRLRWRLARSTQSWGEWLLSILRVVRGWRRHRALERYHLTECLSAWHPALQVVLTDWRPLCLMTLSTSTVNLLIYHIHICICASLSYP